MCNYKAYFLDLDGTVYSGKTPIKEAIKFIKYVQSKGIDPFFVTNNSSMTQIQLQEKLKGMDVHTDTEHIISSSIAAATYIAEHHDGKTVFMIGEQGLKDALEARQVVLTEETAEVVVMGIDHQVNYEKLATACLSIRSGAAFLSTNSDHAFPSERGFLPGNGAFTKLVEHSTGVEPIFLGKPQPFMLQYIQSKYGFTKEEMVMIGDNYQTDILTGIRMGIDTVHVNSGVHRTEDVRKQLEQPTFLLNTLSEWVN